MHIANEQLAAASLTQRYTNFWAWFSEHESAFFAAVQQHNEVESTFLAPLSEALAAVKDGFYFLVGMADDQTAEVIFTADSDISNLVFCEDLVQCAPSLVQWKFTALKQPGDVAEFSINLGDRDFHAGNIWFYPQPQPAYPDEVVIAVVHEALTPEEESQALRGICLFLENYLGELVFATALDEVVAGQANADEELIPITKLQEYLTWRESEFLEQRTAVQHCTDQDEYAGLETELTNGWPLIAVLNTTLLAWPHKAAYPWFARVTLAYDGAPYNGLPDQQVYKQLTEFEEALTAALPEAAGYLNVGRETGNNEREVFLACQEFRQAARTLYLLQQQYAGQLAVTYALYKDSYWRSLERFIAV